MDKKESHMSIHDSVLKDSFRINANKTIDINFSNLKINQRVESIAKLAPSSINNSLSILSNDIDRTFMT